MSAQPDAEVLATFGVRVVTPLGGRLNQHWLVETQYECFVLRRWAVCWASSVEYELRLLERLHARGWPVPYAVTEPIEHEGNTWSLSRFLPGQPPSQHEPLSEQRARGRLLANFHADLREIEGITQRATWRCCDEILSDFGLDDVLTQHELSYPDEVRILRWHLERSRLRFAELASYALPHQLVHGDFTPWNLRFQDGHLTGILDFELAHLDYRLGDFPLAWRGRYDEVIQGYDEVAPLHPEEWQLLTPLWWAFLIEGACTDLSRGTFSDDWAIKKLLQRSPLMGPDASEFR